jgi:hypothetical protein
MEQHYGLIWGGYRWEKLMRERLENPLCLEQYGYKTYSQNDEDGIIEEIFNRIGTTNKRFIEFGVENGLESNTHLLFHKGWSGLWIEGSEKYYKEIQMRFNPVIRNGRLKVINAFITKDNINGLFSSSGMRGEIDLLSIDVDGNDYYVWDAIDVVNPRAVIIEYNGKFPPSVDWTQAYDRNHIWNWNDWQGASLKALERVGEKKGYQLVGTNYIGVNSFFVRKDLAKDKFPMPATAEYLYTPCKFDYVHINGHHSEYCLCDQTENMGIFDYETDNPVSALYGWRDKELQDDGTYSRWMAGTESALLVNPMFLKDCAEIRIPFTIPKLEKEISAKIFAEDMQVMDIEKVPTGGEIVVRKDALDKINREEPLKITIRISDTWVPGKIMNSPDFRELGLGLFGGRAKFITI